MPKIKFTYVNEEGYEEEAELPAYYEVCSRCRGEGVHDNPNFNGFTSEDFDDDPDFLDDYKHGVYDVVCTVCKGKRIVPVVDERKANPRLLKIYNDVQQQLAELEAIERSEMRHCYGPDY